MLWINRTCAGNHVRLSIQIQIGFVIHAYSSKKSRGFLRLGFLDLKSHQFVKYGNVYFLGGS